jgi:toxin secretion/phage lysis holin
MRVYFCTAAGLVGGLIASLFGGWDIAIQCLLLFMAIDYTSGLVVAGVFKRSPNTSTGSLESRAGFKGLCRKAAVLCLVIMAHYLDMVIGADFARDAVCIGFIVNEGLSILENVGLMGVTYPDVIRRALEVLSKRGEDPT